MSLRREHELHTRRYGRNVGVGVLLAALIGIVFGLTVVKVTLDPNMQGTETSDGS